MNAPAFTGADNHVNSFGFISDRQNYTVISVLVILCGLFMFMLTPKVGNKLTARNIRPYPHCAKTIKCTATKCRNCNVETEPISESMIAIGWIVSIPCNKYGSYQSQVAEAVVFLGLPVVHIHGKSVGAGLFHTKHEAIEAQELLLEAYKISSVVEYRNLSEK